MKFKDYYAALGVDENATADEVKRAYRRLAREHHPDLNKSSGSEERFKEVGEAYEVLKDPERRREYDDLRNFGMRGGEDFTPPPGWRSKADFRTGDHSAADTGQFSDFFDSVFGAMGGRRRHGRGGGVESFAMRGDDLHYTMPASVEEACSGAVRTIALQSSRIDKAGRLVPEQRSLKVRIPKGVIDHQKIRLRGQGGEGFGGAENGDLYLEIELQPHPIFSVDGRNLTMVLPVAPWEAALGASIEVPTPGGPVSLTVPANSKAGNRLRLKGRGIPAPKGPDGDLFVSLKIVLPEVKTEADRALFETMRRQMAFEPRRHWGR